MGKNIENIKEYFDRMIRSIREEGITLDEYVEYYNILCVVVNDKLLDNPFDYLNELLNVSTLRDMEHIDRNYFILLQKKVNDLLLLALKNTIESFVYVDEFYGMINETLKKKVISYDTYLKCYKFIEIAFLAEIDGIDILECLNALLDANVMTLNSVNKRRLFEIRNIILGYISLINDKYKRRNR